MDDTLALYGTDADAGDTSQLRAVFDVLSKETLDLVLMLNRSLNLSRLIQTTFMLIEMLQLLSYAVPPSTTYLLSASNNQAFANSFALVLESFNLKFLDRTPGGLAFTITSLLILSWMFLFSYVVFAKRKYGRLQIRDSTAVNVLRFSSMAMASMLSLPILDILFGSTSCFGRGLCSQPASSAQYILVLFLGACFAIMSTIVAACLFDPDPSSPTILARSHSRFDVMFQIIKFGFAFLFNTTKHSFLASSIILPGTAFTAYLFCLYPPYHHLNPVKIRTVGTSSVVWALLCRIVVGVSGTSLEHNAVLIFITTVPFIIGASFFVVEVRRSQLAVRPLLLLKNPLEMTLKANAMLEPVLRARELTNKNLSLAALHGEGNAEKEEIILDRVELLYDEAAKSFPKSAMLQIQRAAFNLYYRRNFYSTQHCLQLAQKDKPRPDEQILIFLLRNRVLHDVRHEPDARIAFKYVQFRNTLDDAMENDKKATLVQLDFWKQLRHHDPDLEKMKKLGTEISKALAKAGSGYEKSLELHPNSATALRMRAGFLHDLINDTETGERLVAQATSAMKNERNERLSNSRNLAKNFKAALFDESNIVIIVSGHPDKLGRITSCNDAAAATLGYEDKTDLCRLNVNRIIPPPISDYHASLMRSNLERGIIAFSSKTRLVLLQHRSGYVFPASMYVSMFCENSTNISFIAVMTRFSTKSVYCAVTDETGTVFAISEEAETLFEIQPAEVGSINISELVPDFEENIHKFMYEGGFDMPFIPRKNRTEALAALASGQGTRKMLNVRIQAIKPPGQSAVHLVMMRITEKIKVSATKSRTSASQAGENEHALSMSSSEGQVDEGPPGSMAGNRHAGIVLAAPSHRSGVTGGAGGNSSKKKYAQSSIGRSSRSSGMSGMSANMRKRVLSSTNTGMTSNIQRFQIIFTLTLAVIMLVAVVTFVATDNLYTEFRADVKLVTEVAKRRFDAVDAAYAMHILVLHDFSLATAAERTAAIATLHAASDKLFAQSFELYNRRLDMNTAHQQQWNEQTLLLHELTRSDTVESQKYTIWDASLMLVNSARAAAVQAEQTQLPTLKNESNAFMTLNNSAFGILGALNTSTVHVQAQTEGLVAWTGIWATTVNAAAVLIMFVEVWIIVRPAIRQIEANKRAVIDIFREIPVLYVEQLTWRCSIRRNLHENIRYEGLFKSEHLKNYFVDKVEKNFEFDNAVQAETKETLQSNTRNGGSKSLLSRNSSSILGGTPGGGNTNHSPTNTGRPSIQKVTSATPTGETAEQRRARRSASRIEMNRLKQQQKKRFDFHISLTTQVMLGLIVCATYFFLAYLGGYVSISETMNNKPAECNWATYRQMSLRNVLLLLRFLATPLTTGLNLSSDQVSSAIRELERVHKGLVFGDKSMGVDGAVNIFNLQSFLLFENGCVPSTDLECLRFENKLLESGLNSGIQEFVRSSETVLQEISDQCPSFSCDTSERMNSAFNQARLRTLETLESKYLQPTLQESVNKYLEALDKKMGEEFRQVSLLMLGTFIIVMTLMFFFMYRPMIVNLDQQVKETRTILLMIPDSVLSMVPKVRDFLKSNVSGV